MKPFPPAGMKAGFFSPYIIVPKKSGGLRPILGLRILNWASHKPPFKMLMQKCIFGCIRPRDRSAVVELKDSYFDVAIFPRHRSVLRFAFEGRAYKYKVLPFGLSLSPRVFTKVAEAALVPLREQGMHILNYLEDWLILAQDQLWRTQGLGALAPQPVGPSGQLGKEQTLPDAEDLFSRYGVGFGQSGSAPNAGTRSVGVELLEYVQEQDGGTTETVSEGPGAYGGCHAAEATPERHAVGPSHSSLPPNLHPVVRPFVPSGRSSPGTGLQSRWGLHGCLRGCLGRDTEVLGDLPQEVADTITSARAPSTRHAYALKWNLFVEWCSFHREDPRRCPIRVVLSFLQQGLERRLSPSTLKVYVAVIASNHDPVEGKPVGKHDWVVKFLRGARRLNPPRPPSIPSWDLSLVLRALQQGPFEPLQTVEPKFLSMKTLLLLALASIKRVGDLHAFSVDDSCLQFGPADSQIILRPRPGYVPKVPTTPFRDQVVSLQALPLEDRTQSFRTSDQRSPAERECHIQAEDGPLDSGCHHPGLSGTGCALPVQIESSFYKKCGFLLGAGSWRLADRYL